MDKYLQGDSENERFKYHHQNKRSYFCDTFSSLEKKILKNQVTLLGD